MHYKDMPWPVWLILCSTSVVKKQSVTSSLSSTVVITFPSSEVPPLLISTYFIFQKKCSFINNYSLGLVVWRVSCWQLWNEPWNLDVNTVCNSLFGVFWYGRIAQFWVYFHLSNHAFAPVDCYLCLSVQNKTIYRHWVIFFNLFNWRDRRHDSWAYFLKCNSI